MTFKQVWMIDIPINNNNNDDEEQEQQQKQ